MSEDKREAREKKAKATGDRGGAPVGKEKATEGLGGEKHQGLHGFTNKELEDKVAELEERLRETEIKSREYLEDAQRNRAELENYRKRMLREQTRIIEEANRSLIAALLPVIDNLEMALGSCGDRDDQVAQGVHMVYEQLMEVLKREGLEEIDPRGHHFDPEVCEAVMAVVSDDHEDETVVEVHQKGYKYKGVLLRPARATVSKCG